MSRANAFCQLLHSQDKQEIKHTEVQQAMPNIIPMQHSKNMQKV